MPLQTPTLAVHLPAPMGYAAVTSVSVRVRAQGCQGCGWAGLGWETTALLAVGVGTQCDVQHGRLPTHAYTASGSLLP